MDSRACRIVLVIGCERLLGLILLWSNDYNGRINLSIDNGRILTNRCLVGLLIRIALRAGIAINRSAGRVVLIVRR